MAATKQVHRRRSEAARSGHDVMLRDSTQTLKTRKGQSSSKSTKVGLWTILIVLICVYAASRFLSSDESDAVPQLRDNQIASSSKQPTSDKGSATGGNKKNAPADKAKSYPGKICSRNVPNDLSDPSTWPGQYTPSYFDGEPPYSAKNAVLMKKEPQPTFDHDEDKFRVINDYFAALDLAYEKKCQVYITKDCNWFWDTLIDLFFGSKFQADDEFWRKMQDTLGVIIIDDEAAATAMGKELTIVAPKQQINSSLTAEQVQMRRDTIFRKMFQHSPVKMNSDLCHPFVLWGLDSNFAHAVYTVLAPSVSQQTFSRFKEATGKDYIGMTSKYVKDVLSHLNMHDKNNFIFIKGDRSYKDHEDIKPLLEDTELRTFGAEKETDDYLDGTMMHLAVLADLFIADPTQWSLMIARMRFAMGMENTYVLTEKNNGQADGDTQLQFYDRDHLGLWMG